MHWNISHVVALFLIRVIRILGFLSLAVTLSLVSGFILMDICVVLSPVDRVLPRLVILLRSLHQFLSTVYLWVEYYLLPLQVPFSLRYYIPTGLFSRFLVVRPNHLALGRVLVSLPAHEIQFSSWYSSLVQFHLTSLYESSVISFWFQSLDFYQC